MPKIIRQMVKGKGKSDSYTSFTIIRTLNNKTTNKQKPLTDPPEDWIRTLSALTSSMSPADAISVTPPDPAISTLLFSEVTLSESKQAIEVIYDLFMFTFHSTVLTTLQSLTLDITVSCYFELLLPCLNSVSVSAITKIDTVLAEEKKTWFY